MGAAASSAIPGQTLPPLASPRKFGGKPNRESIIAQEEMSAAIDPLAKAKLFDTISKSYVMEFNQLEREQMSQREKAAFLDHLYSDLKRLAVQNVPSSQCTSEYLSQFSPRKIDTKKHVTKRFREKPEERETPRFKEAYEGKRTAFIRGVGVAGKEGKSEKLLRFPGKGGGMAFLKNGDLVFADTDNHRIVIISGTGGEFLSSFGSYGAGDGQFNEPRGVAVSQEGLVVVADTNNHRLQIFTREGEFVKSIGANGNRLGEFDSPQGVSISKYNTIAVADTGNHRVQLIRFVDGRTQLSFGGYGKTKGTFDTPVDVAFWNDGMLAIADYGNNRVQIHFMLDGSYERTIGEESFGVHVDGTGPTSVGVDKYQNLAVCAPRLPASESCVLIYDRFGNGIGQLLRGRLRSKNIFTVACDSDTVGPGTYAIADSENHVVYVC